MEFFKDENGENWRPWNLNNYNYFQNLPLLDLVETPSQPGYYLCSLGYKSVDASTGTKKYQGLTLSVKPISQKTKYPHVTYSFPIDTDNYIFAAYHYSAGSNSKTSLHIGSREYVQLLQIIVKEGIKEFDYSLLGNLFNLFFR